MFLKKSKGWQEKILDTSFFMRYDSQGAIKKGGFCRGKNSGTGFAI